MRKNTERPPTQQGLAKAAHLLGVPVGRHRADVNPDFFPAVTLDVAPRPDFAQTLAFAKSTNRHRRGFGRRITGFDQTLHTIGARAAKVGQEVQPPEVEPHITFLSADETRNFLRSYDNGEQQLRDEADQLTDVHADIPYSVHATENGVFAYIANQTWEGERQVNAVRQRLGFDTQAEGGSEPWAMVQLACYTTLKPRFAERVEQINKYDLLLTVGRLVLFRY